MNIDRYLSKTADTLDNSQDTHNLLRIATILDERGDTKLAIHFLDAVQQGAREERIASAQQIAMMSKMMGGYKTKYKHAKDRARKAKKGSSIREKAVSAMKFWRKKGKSLKDKLRSISKKGKNKVNLEKAVKKKGKGLIKKMQEGYKKYEKNDMERKETGPDFRKHWEKIRPGR